MQPCASSFIRPDDELPPPRLHHSSRKLAASWGESFPNAVIFDRPQSTLKHDDQNAHSSLLFSCARLDTLFSHCDATVQLGATRRDAKPVGSCKLSAASFQTNDFRQPSAHAILLFLTLLSTATPRFEPSTNSTWYVATAVRFRYTSESLCSRRSGLATKRSTGARTETSPSKVARSRCGLPF